ncbi:hypothetical protein ccbrp13_47120 [Ktedonobacteria bacterium brp13]|nr:hypothetical protein ccbrp13_47120 [Ktedonobacteria bacterium brp13]
MVDYSASIAVVDYSAGIAVVDYSAGIAVADYQNRKSLIHILYFQLSGRM